MKTATINDTGTAEKMPLSLAAAWPLLRKTEPLAWGCLYLCVSSRPAWTETSVASAWATSPTRVRRELAVGVGWLELQTHLSAGEILERLRAGEVAA